MKGYFRMGLSWALLQTQLNSEVAVFALVGLNYLVVALLLFIFLFLTQIERPCVNYLFVHRRRPTIFNSLCC